jgi:hypothetical protein
MKWSVDGGVFFVDLMSFSMQHFLKYIMEPSLANKNETKLVKKIYRIEPRMEDAAVQDVTQIDWVLNPFNIQLPSFDLWHHVMDDFAPAMAGSCQGIFTFLKHNHFSSFLFEGGFLVNEKVFFFLKTWLG